MFEYAISALKDRLKIYKKLLKQTIFIGESKEQWENRVTELQQAIKILKENNNV